MPLGLAGHAHGPHSRAELAVAFNGAAINEATIPPKEPDDRIYSGVQSTSHASLLCVHCVAAWGAVL